MDSSLKSIAYLYIHFSFSTDDELSVNEIDMISEKVNDIFNPDEDNYKETFRLVTDTLFSYNNMTIAEKDARFLKVKQSLKEDLSENQKNDIVDDLSDISRADSINQSEIDFIDKLKKEIID